MTVDRCCQPAPGFPCCLFGTCSSCTTRAPRKIVSFSRPAGRRSKHVPNHRVLLHARMPDMDGCLETRAKSLAALHLCLAPLAACPRSHQATCCVGSGQNCQCGNSTPRSQKQQRKASNVSIRRLVILPDTRGVTADAARSRPVSVSALAECTRAHAALQHAANPTDAGLTADAIGRSRCSVGGIKNRIVLQNMMEPHCDTRISAPTATRARSCELR